MAKKSLKCLQTKTMPHLQLWCRIVSESLKILHTIFFVRPTILIRNVEMTRACDISNETIERENYVFNVCFERVL